MIWISVDERLPAANYKVLVCGVDVYGRRALMLAKHLPRWSMPESADCAEVDVCEYHEERDEYYYREGWWECSENFEEFGMVFLDDTKVTHWMPLPAKPASPDVAAPSVVDLAKNV